MADPSSYGYSFVAADGCDLRDRARWLERRGRSDPPVRAVTDGLRADGTRPRRRPSRASRIVSLVPAVTEMLFAIGAGSKVIAVSSFDTFPPEVRKLPQVGALIDPDTERILALRPDLVVIYGSQQDTRARFERAGIRIFAYRHGGLAAMLDTMRQVGAATGRSRCGRRGYRATGPTATRSAARPRARPATPPNTAGVRAITANPAWYLRQRRSRIPQ